MITFITNSGMRSIDPYLAHHGIKGQEWGKRRFQYADGRLTPEGRIRYRKGVRTANVYRKEAEKTRRKYEKALINNTIYNRTAKNLDEKREAYERAKAKSEHFEALMKETFGDIQEKYGDAKVQKIDREKINSDLDAAISDYYKSKGDDYASDTEEDFENWLKENRGQHEDAAKTVLGPDDTDAMKKKSGADFDGDTIDPKYLEKVETSSGDTRYFYDKDELKAYKDGKSGASDKDLDDAYKKMRNSSKTDEEKDLKEHYWNNARDNDRWDINFLEAIQNSAILERNDKKSLLTEYAKYMADPSDYWENGRHQLEDASWARG